jgi:hypothetical protein
MKTIFSEIFAKLILAFGRLGNLALKCAMTSQDPPRFEKQKLKIDFKKIL